MKAAIIAGGVVPSVLSAPGAHAEDDTGPEIYYPYKKDGPHRDWYLQSGIAKCIKVYKDTGLGSQKEVQTFCDCKFLFS
jgi:hypothetical protein